jgi:hypothetical protein
MKHYETAIPRVALGIAAVAMTAMTLGVSVIFPANMESSSGGRHLAAWRHAPPASMGAQAATSIKVVATREAVSVPVPCRLAKSDSHVEG